MKSQTHIVFAKNMLFAIGACFVAFAASVMVILFFGMAVSSQNHMIAWYLLGLVVSAWFGNMCAVKLLNKGEDPNV